MKNNIDFEKAYGYITVGDTQYLRLSENDEWKEFFTVDDDTEEVYKKKDNKLLATILIITNIFTIILFTIALVFYKDCYNEMNKIQKELVEKKHEVEVLKDRTRLLEEDVRDYQNWISNQGWLEGDYTYCENGECKNFNEETTCKWYERFYDEFHEEVGAYE